MRELVGKSVYEGIAIGPILLWKSNGLPIERRTVEDVSAEMGRVHAAVEQAKEQLGNLYEKAAREAGEASAAIFEAHRMMLEDEYYLDSIDSMVRGQKVNAEYAVEMVGDKFSQIFANMDDDYMKARSADVLDVSQLVVQNLLGRQEADFSDMEPSIIIADDLTPSETVQMDKSKILAFVTVHGSATSHTAILARTMNIPALVGVEMGLEDILSGQVAIVDGFQGKLLLDPTEADIQAAKERMVKAREQEKLLGAMRGKETVTPDGRKLRLYANIGNVDDVYEALRNDAEGIGLFRSEFLFIGREEPPTEEEQFLAYRQVLEAMAGKKVVIRTLDLGADKQADYLDLGKEDNPAMGCRAIRLCLSRTDIFRTQLRALFRAAVFGNLAVMYPMIISVEEVEQIQKIVGEVQEELEQQGVPYMVPEQGLMVETPAAAMISDRLAERADFFSIGTNDLTQYTLAIDRQNGRLDAFYDPHHEAVLRMIRMVIENAHRAGIWVGICGELGADMELTETFLEMGVDELSVAPPMVLPIRKKIREMARSERGGMDGLGKEVAG